MTRIADEMVITPDVVDAARLRSAVRRAREYGIILPTFGGLADPQRAGSSAAEGDPDAPRLENLWRVNWYNVVRSASAQVDDARPHRAAGNPHRREGADRRLARLPLPDDRRAQGAAGLRGAWCRGW